MRGLAIVIKIIGILQGIFAIGFLGIMPAIAGVWVWADFGVPMVLGLASCIIFINLGEWLGKRARARHEEAAN